MSEGAFPGLFVFIIDPDASTATHWKLAKDNKERLADAGFLEADYDEATEGWIVKEFDGHSTLEFYRELRR